MKLKHSRSLLLGLAAGGLGACAGSPDAPPRPTDAIKLAVAPLSLEGIGFACYDVEVRNDLDEVVWSQGTSAQEGAAPAICSSQYGNATGGDVTYIGPCDASENDGTDAGAAINTATLRLDGLYDANGVDLGSYQNPCAWPDGCALSFPCVENADTLVEFNLTIMREANQGFFDVAVNFEDIFCSAKVDCVDALLHNGDTRDATVVVGFACTSGENEKSVLHLSDLTLTCDGLAPMTLSAMAAPGQQGAVGGGVFQWAVYQGEEELTSNGQPLEKCYWNRAVGIDKAALAGKACHLSGTATATTDGVAPPPNTTAYPVVSFEVDVLAADGTLCDPNPLNGQGSGVTTQYVSATSTLLAQSPLAAKRDCTAGAQNTTTTSTTAFSCRDMAGGTNTNWGASQPSADAIVVQNGGRTTTIPLTGALAGFTLGGECCLDDCCVP